MAQIQVGSVKEAGKSPGLDLAGAQATRHWKIKRAWAWQEVPGCTGAGVRRETAALLLWGVPGERAT